MLITIGKRVSPRIIVFFPKKIYCYTYTRFDPSLIDQRPFFFVANFLPRLLMLEKIRGVNQKPKKIWAYETGRDILRFHILMVLLS